MLGKPLASRLLTFNPTTSLCPSSHDLAGTTAASTPGCVKSSCVVRMNHTSDTRICISASKNWKLHSAAQIDNLVLNDEEKKTWDSCRQTLSSFKFSTEEEDKILGKAFGYIHTPYWYEERKKEVPQLEAMNKTLNYLRSLNLTDDDLCKVLKKFPEVLGCSLEDELKSNVLVLAKQWGIEGKSLRNLLLRNPKVLGYNVDCKGDCEAKCTRCWARFLLYLWFSFCTYIILNYRNIVSPKICIVCISFLQELSHTIFLLTSPFSFVMTSNCVLYLLTKFSRPRFSLGYHLTHCILFGSFE